MICAFRLRPCFLRRPFHGPVDLVGHVLERDVHGTILEPFCRLLASRALPGVTEIVLLVHMFRKIAPLIAILDRAARGTRRTQAASAAEVSPVVRVQLRQPEHFRSRTIPLQEGRTRHHEHVRGMLPDRASQRHADVGRGRGAGQRAEAGREIGAGRLRHHHRDAEVADWRRSATSRRTSSIWRSRTITTITSPTPISLRTRLGWCAKWSATRCSRRSLQTR